MSLNYTIYKIFKNIVYDESIGKIEAINDYTKHTLKSVIKFIENDFKSQLKEIKDNKDGKFHKDISFNLKDHLSKYRQNLLPKFNNWLEQFDKFIKENYSQLNIKQSKTHPYVISSENGKIFAYSSNGEKLIIHFVTRNFRNPLIMKKLIIKELKIKESDWGVNVYKDIKIEKMKEIFRIYMSIIEKETNSYF